MGWLSRVFRGDTRAPRDVDAALRAALLSVLDRDYDEAEKMLLAAVRLDSDAVEPYLALARLLRMRGGIGRAIRIHQNLLLRLDPASKYGREALAGLAADFRQGGLLQRAIASYEELVSRDSKHVEALRMLLRLHTEVRNFERAIEVAKRLARLEGADGARAEAALRVQMAETARAEGRSDEARRAVKQALRKDKQNVRAWIVLGDLEAERDRGRGLGPGARDRSQQRAAGVSAARGDLRRVGAPARVRGLLARAAGGASGGFRSPARAGVYPRREGRHGRRRGRAASHPGKRAG